MSRKRKSKKRVTPNDVPLRRVVPSLPQNQQEWISEEDRELFLEAVDSLKGFQGDLIAEKYDSLESHPPIVRPKKKPLLRGPGECIETTLDLHGSSRTEAVNRIEKFCRLSARRGILTITVITGRGLHSQSRKSVLKQEIIRWLDSEKGRKLVESYRSGFPHQGGDGVLILYLYQP